MKKRQFIHILHRYIEGTATIEECKLIETYYNFLLAKSKLDSARNNESNGVLKKELLNKIWDEIKKEEKAKSNIMTLRNGLRIAATITVLLGIGIMYYAYRANQSKERGQFFGIKEKSGKAGIKPGGNIAVLTLANGKRIALDSVSNGFLAQQGNISIIKLNNGQVRYQILSQGNSKDSHPVYNILNTPRGGQYEIVLPDGTKVWLNAASSLKYPVTFTGTTRCVEMTGEGYFEVAPNTQKPFIVNVGGVNVEVLGTRFNINSYEEDEIKTTLVDGAIRVMGGNKKVLLKPGEAAGFDKMTGGMEVRKANVAAAIAWKNGLFYFDNTGIKEIMDQVSRWYNVKVVFSTNKLSYKVYSGKLPRYSEISDLLKMLEMTGTIHFEIKDKTIIVMN